MTNRDEMEQQLDTGLVKGHAYGLSDVKKVKRYTTDKTIKNILMRKIQNKLN